MPAGATDAARFHAIEAKQKALVEECEQNKGHRCRVAAFDGGLQYTLIDAVEIEDVRLVYAPPRSVGEFGGEVDNFAWPRHAGDFAIGRAYVDGQPYRNQFYFPISANGVKPGDFVMVLGYPGITYRSLTAAEMEERRDLFFPSRVSLYGEWIGLLEKVTENSPSGRIAVAANLKSLNNSFKNAQGQLEGFRRGRILEQQRSREQEIVTWAAAHPEYSSALDARNELSRLVDEQHRTYNRDFLLNAIPNGPKLLYFATTLVRAAEEREKADPERDPAYQAREMPRLRERLEREQKNFFLPADMALLASFAKRALSLEPAERLAMMQVDIDGLYGRTRVTDLAERLKMFDETTAQLRARHDPALDLAFELEKAREEMKQREDTWNGAISRLRPVWRKAVIAQAGRPVAPDANRSLRVSLAHVKGYTPRDAVLYEPRTTLSGMLDKYTGKDPFDAPADVLAAARAGDFGRWADATLKDVPIDFLSDADTTGGNSGSPTVNGRGELVGVNFDRVWENVANDFG